MVDGRNGLIGVYALNHADLAISQSLELVPTQPRVEPVRVVLENP